MTGRDRLLAALSPDGVDGFPVVVPYEELFARDHWSQISNQPWFHQLSYNLYDQRHWRRELYQAFDQDWFILPEFYSLDDRRRYMIVERDGKAYRRDALSGELIELSSNDIGSFGDDSISTGLLPADSPINEDAIDLCIFNIDPETSSVADGGALSDPQTEPSGDLAEKLLSLNRDRRAPYRQLATPLWSCYELFGFERLMTLIADSPDIVEYAANRFLELLIADAGRCARDGAEIVWLEETLGDLIAPDAHLKLGLGYTARLIDAINELEMKSVLYYTGDPRGRVDILAACGPDALAFEESKKGFEVDCLEIAKELRGRTALFGNIDSVRCLGGDDAALKQAVERQRAAGMENNGRFIFSLGSPVPSPVSIERVRRYIAYARDAGV